MVWGSTWWCRRPTYRSSWTPRASCCPILAVPVILLPTLVLIVDFGIAVRFGVHEWLPQRALARQMGAEIEAAGFPTGFPLLHLWFLYYLCFFYLAVPACHVLTRWTARHEAAVTGFLTSARAPLVFVVLTCVTLWPYKGAVVMEGFVFVKPHVPSLLYYGSFFVLGYVFQHHRAVLPMMAGLAPAADGSRGSSGRREVRAGPSR